MKEECIFCKIISGDIPSFTIYEDERYKVILDRFPTSPGHALILPKSHHVDIFDMPDETAYGMYPLAKKIAVLLSKAMQADGINIVQNNGEAAGQAVFHFHLHLIPRKYGDGVRLNQTSGQDTTIEELAEVFEKIKSCGSI
ncbi:HIT family protein [Cellulosilyticum sp. I15G10I2]|uniref:HIT family protein n=1 Tax=Cellulosilyticum sp. I15G10I2 TaxID=1892843 RepID=UPI00085C9C75|nr:HIT family protein [Cellulosilyticum sp. I15G10I2]